MFKPKKILIIDDNYWHYIYRGLTNSVERWKFSFPVRNNTIDPLKYYRYILKNKPDFIIMWTWYKHSNHYTPKWITLLEKLVWYYGKIVESSSNFLWLKFNKSKQYKMSWFNSKIIYICDMWKINTKKFSIFKYFDNITFIPDKNIMKIINYINNN